MENQNKVIKRYWIAGYPYFESRAFFIPNDMKEDYESTVKMQIFDPDGTMINEIKMVVNSAQPLILDLENFMGDCKPESGLKYCQLICEMEECIDSYIRLQMKKSGSYIAQLKDFNEKTNLFLPITFSKDKSSILILSNELETPVQVCCKILKGNRAPEKNITLSAMGSRLIFLKNEFQEIFGEMDETEARAYIRLSAIQNVSLVGAQILDYIENNSEEGVFSSIA